MRTLSKSDFTLARTCPTKLFFRENGYPDRRDADAYLALLAEGGYMVEALAKARYPNGIQLEYGVGAVVDFEQTKRILDQPSVTLFEATLLVGRRQARVDILEKTGSHVRLLEVKAKSFDGQEHLAKLADGGNGAFRAKKKLGGVLGEWRQKLEDLTYQFLLLEKVMPNADIRPYLVLTDKSKRAAVDDVPRFFELVHRTDSTGSRRLQTARYIGTPGELASLDLLTEVDVSDEVALLRDEVEEAAARFEASLDSPLEAFKVNADLGSKCVKCEFRHEDEIRPDGFIDCWGPLSQAKPHLLELFSVGSANAPDKSPLIEWMVGAGTGSLLDIPVDGLVKADGTIGPVAARQRRQIEYTKSGTVWIGPALRGHIESLSGPISFIDFETSRLALPYHARMRPYGLVGFQWSCHSVASLGSRPAHSEWLNSVDVWPNQSFVESLRAAVGDTGPVMTWSHHEASVLKEIVRDLDEFGRRAPELNGWVGDLVDHRIVDLHRWAQTQYYHPGMRGRTSIKVVLDALWKSDPQMRAQFELWTGLVADAASDPYSSLAPVEINGLLQDVHEGTGAVRAYQEMMYGADKNDPSIKERWAGLLRQYCELDTLSMVLIFEHWRRATGLE